MRTLNKKINHSVFTYCKKCNSFTFLISILIIFLIILFSPGNIICQSGWYSLNSGTNIVFYDSYFFNENTGWACGEHGSLIKTTNGGLNWMAYSLPTTNNISGISFINESTGWLSASNGYYVGMILKTTSGGATWVIQSAPVNLAFWNVKFVNENTGWICGWSGTILKTTNGGSYWFSQTSGFSDEYYQLSITNESTVYIVGTNSRILKTSNGGTNWFQQQSGVTSALRWVYFINPNTGWITGYNGTILKTTNAGQNWLNKSFGLSNYLTCIHFINDNTGYICGNNGIILKSITGGNNWLQQTSGTNLQLNTIFFANPTTGWITGNNGAILKTINGGIAVPQVPTLVSPANNSTNNSTTPTLVWNSSVGADRYKVLISSVPNMSLITDSATVTSAQYTVPPEKLLIAHTYYWSVNASNSVGSSPYSSIWNFATFAVPIAPVLVSPVNGLIGLPLTPNLVWYSASGATNYKVQISSISNFGAISDSATVSGTNYNVPSGRLTDMTTYFWRVNAGNNYGQSPWSTVWSFTVMTTGIKLYSSEIPDRFRLFNNYPNPFNPSTKIKFDVPLVGQRRAFDVQLFVYDALGREVDVILNRELIPGKYEITWNAEKLSSGMYFLLMRSHDISFTQKMLLVK